MQTPHDQAASTIAASTITVERNTPSQQHHAPPIKINPVLRRTKTLGMQPRRFKPRRRIGELVFEKVPSYPSSPIDTPITTPQQPTPPRKETQPQASIDIQQKHCSSSSSSSSPPPTQAKLRPVLSNNARPYQAEAFEACQQTDKGQSCWKAYKKELLKSQSDQEYPLSSRHLSWCDYASKMGHHVCLLIAHEMGHDWDNETCALASEAGSVECLRFLYENGCPCDESVCERAVSGGWTQKHQECFFFADSKGCQWGTKTCVAAVRHDHYDVLVLASQKNKQVDQSITMELAKKGDFNMLSRLVSRGWPFNRQVCMALLGQFLVDKKEEFDRSKRAL